MISFTIVKPRTGRARPLGDKGHLSAIDMQPTSGLVLARPEGLEGAEQADRQHHGGRDKALHAYQIRAESHVVHGVVASTLVTHLAK